MVVTVEPGLYVAPDDETVDAKWHWYSYEDDIVVTVRTIILDWRNVVKPLILKV